MSEAEDACGLPTSELSETERDEVSRKKAESLLPSQEQMIAFAKAHPVPQQWYDEDWEEDRESDTDDEPCFQSPAAVVCLLLLWLGFAVGSCGLLIWTAF